MVQACKKNEYRELVYDIYLVNKSGKKRKYIKKYKKKSNNANRNEAFDRSKKLRTLFIEEKPIT